MRAEKLKTQTELTFKQMNTSGTELDCFLALQRQEKLAASFRIKGLWEEVQKQKELEKTLQKRYGDLVTELERVQQLINQHRIQAQKLEEMEAKKLAEELAEKEANEAAPPSSEILDPASAMEVDVSDNLKPHQHGDGTEMVNGANSENDMNIDGDATLAANTLPDSEIVRDQHVDGTKVSDSVSENKENVGEAIESNGFVEGESVSTSKMENQGVDREPDSEINTEEVNQPTIEGNTEDSLDKTDNGGSDFQA